MLRGGGACLALFAAANALHMGFVRGVVPYAYVPRLNPPNVRGWNGVVTAESDEPPDFIVREAPAPQSVFRATVNAGGVPVSDVLQIWLDVASYPACGQQQADFIRRRFLESVIAGHRDRG